MSGNGLISRRAFAGGVLFAGLGGEALAQGFAGLGESASGYAAVVPGKTFSFPADHGPHPEFRIEWWYVTANLADATAPPMVRSGRCSGKRQSPARNKKAGLIS